MTSVPDDAAAFLALTDKIGRDRGFGAEQYKDTCLRRRIAVRMRACNVTTYTDYIRLLDQDPEEYDRVMAVKYAASGMFSLFLGTVLWLQASGRLPSVP